MLVSVIIPVYNGTATLERTLQSFLAQEMGPGQQFELVLCDDGSTDASSEILGRYAENPKVSVIYQSNQGQSAASNHAARLARGELLLFSAQDIVPQDCNFIRHHIQGHYQAEGDCCLTGYIRYPEELLITDFMVFMQDGDQQFAYRNISDPDNLDPMRLYAPNFSVQKTWFFKVGGFDEHFRYGFQDTDLGIRFFLAGLKLCLADNITGLHYHPLQLSEYALKKRSFGRLFWDLYFKQRDYFEIICQPNTSISNILAPCVRFSSQRDLFERIFREISYFQDRDIEPLEDLYYEFSERVASLPPLSDDVPIFDKLPRSKRSWCKYFYYSSYLTFCYSQGLAERAMELGLLKPGEIDVTPVV